MIRACVELARIHKPAGYFLFLWPFVWGLTMAAYKQRIDYSEYLQLLLKSLFGSFIMRSSACTVNDILDREIDAAIERTRSRPLPSGRISVLAATLFLAFQFIIGTMFFATYSTSAFWIAIFQMIPLLSTYPLMKRITYWPQAWLGIAINCGFAVSWLSVTADRIGGLWQPIVMCMLASLWCWTLLYDTIYGCQDREDDIKAGVRSTAVLFGRYTVSVVKCFAAGFIGFLYAAGKANDQGMPYFAICIGLTTTLLAWQFYILDVNSSVSCWNNFKYNAYYFGLVIYVGLLADYIRVMSFTESRVHT